MAVIANYLNGNVKVTLEDDGTRVMEVPDGEDWNFEYPTNIDVTITHKCNLECPYCYMGCTKDGIHADIMSYKFFDTLLPGSECAINLNDMSHPQLFPFLSKMKERGVFVNGTVNQVHFMEYHHVIKTLCDSHLLWGLGISLQKPNTEFIKLVKEIPNAVIHVINGILDADDIEVMRDKGLKLLILGYKESNRGGEYKQDNQAMINIKQKYLYDVLPTMVNHFDVLSFDNMAIEQLNVKRIIPKDKWDEFYQGDEGSCTFAVDLVTEKFSQNSTITDPARLYPITDDIREMFNVIKGELHGYPC